MSGPVLLMIGPIRLEVAPFAVMDYQRGAETSFAEKAVIGASPVLEWTGDGAETWTIRGRLFPERFGGEGSLTELDAVRRSGRPQYLMRGDGRVMGWVVIERVSERSTHLDRRGVGKMIEVDITVRRVRRPAAGLYFSLMGVALGLLK